MHLARPGFLPIVGRARLRPFTCGVHSPAKPTKKLAATHQGPIVSFSSGLPVSGMRYVRFLKTPRIVQDKNRPSAHVSCLITITSDLGDSFLPCRIGLSAELIQDRPAVNLSDGDTNSEPQSPPAEVPTIANNVITWKTIQWTEGMRSLPVTIPLSRNYKQNGPLIVRIGTEPKSNHDELEKLLLPESRGVVSVWSAPFNLRDETSVSRTVERRFQIGDRVHRILEETGESIARHVWYGYVYQTIMDICRTNPSKGCGCHLVLPATSSLGQARHLGQELETSAGECGGRFRRNTTAFSGC